MANLKTVQVPAEVKLQVANQAQVMRNLYKDFQDIFASVDPGSAFGKSIAKAFSKVESKLSASEGLLSGEFFSEADLRKVASQLSNISELFGQINIQARGVSASTLGLDTTEIENAEKHLRQLQDRVRELKKAKVGTLLGADSKDLQAFAKLSGTTGFSGGKSYAENYKSMETVIGRVIEKYGQLTTEAQAAEEAARQANEEVAKARVNLNMAEGQLANRKQANLNAANQIMGVKVSGKGATRDFITEQYLSILDSQLDQGQWVAGGENFAHIIAGWLEVDEADLAGTATDIVNNLKNAIRTAMAGGPIASNKLRASAKSVLGGEEAALRKDAGYVELEQKVQTSTTYVQGAEIAAEEALSTLQAANNTVEQTRQLLEQIQTQMARLKELQDEYNAAVDAQHREQIDAARQGVSTAKANTKAGTINATEEASKTAGRIAQGVQTNLSQMQTMREAADAQTKAEAAAAKESEQFSANLKASVARWMSVQQIVNIIKNGIRQAYQDIQGLDKAMTNIAVVTDMSVGDLWGKINEYMSIAQQYGVTTQGVYEVSQLYYQQGLSTSEVMAATTETLKMARIAGMGYAEAADAMTVAIRAFKMEMTDAQHITDVYSKVAAVTASDTEELAIAMSKTASSAESVGSSFENTTAMLAVMIETTRESAQNLGSALKSIISRYGEMKVGLTVDSEGEEIDYNKVDTALKSVGISIKDAQGQFRDFDEVIFELSENWDSLDKNTQRYIATIMAGNRQQSRFIALVDNWERLDEVAGAAEDSEDAGLLQYAKTLDSLETKLNNIKTSFQQFYMSIFNGPLIGKGLDFINDIIQGFNKLSKFTSILNIASIVSGLKLIGTIIVNTFSSSFGQISAGWKQMLQNLALNARAGGQQASQNFLQGSQSGKGAPALSGKATLGMSVLSLLGTGLSFAGSAIAGENQAAGTVMSSLGSGIQIGTMVGMINPLAGIITGALTAIISGIASWPSELEKAQQDLQKAEEIAEETNIERAKKKEEVRNLETTINNLEKLQKARYKSEEAEQAFIEASKSAAEQFPQLITTYDDAGNAIIDVINQSAEAEWLLIKARKEAADATETAAAAELKTALSEKRAIEEKTANYDDSSSATGIGNYYNNWATDILRIFDIEDGDFADNADDIWAPVDEGLAAIFTKYESGDNSIAGGLKMLLEDLQSGALDPYLERANYTQEDFLNYIKDYINTYNLWDNNGWGGQDIDSILDLYGDYNLLIAEQEANSARIEAAMRAVGRSKINSLLTAKDPTETAAWREISGAETFLSDAILDKANLTDADFDKDGKLTSAAQTRLDQIFIETYNNYENFCNSLGYDLEEFNNLIQSSSKGIITKSQVDKQFEDFFGDEKTWDEITHTYYDQIVENIEENKTRLISDLNNNRISTKWATYAVVGGEFETIIDNIPAAFYAYISDFADDIDSRLQTGTLTQSQADSVITSYFDVLGKLDDKALGLTDGQFAEAQRLITEAAADGSLFSLSGIQTLITALQEAGIDVSYLDLENFPVYTANLVTEWATLQDKLVHNLTTATEAIQKASEGMSLDEALKLAQKTGMDWSNFTFIDGKWYTSNIEAIKTYYEDEQKRIIAQLEKEKKRLQGTSDQAGTLDTGLGIEDLNIIKGLSLEEFQKEYSIEYGDNPEVWQAIQTYWDPEHYAQEAANHIGDDSWGMAQYWEDYFTSLGQNVSAETQKALTYYAEQSEKAAKKAELVASLNESAKNKGVDMDKVSAYQTIASQGLLGYSTEDIAAIAMAMNWEEGVQFELDKTTGTYKIKEEYLSELPAEYYRQVDSLLRSETESALNSIRSLGTSLANGEVGVYADAFIKTLPDAETVIPALIKAGDYEELKTKIAAELSARTEEVIDVNDPRVIKAANETIAGYNDGMDENILRYIELKKKELFGTITEAEKLELDGIVDTGELSTELTDAFANAGSKTIEKYIAAMKGAIASGADFEKVEKDIKNGYLAQLQYFGTGVEDISTLDAFDIMQNISEAEGQYTNDMLASMFSQVYAETGNEVNMSDFLEYFEIDPETKNWVLKAGESINDFLAEEYGEKVPEWITGAFNTSEAQKAVNDAIELDDLGTNVTNTVGTMISNLTNASLSDLVSLYESIYGKDSFADSGLLESYQNALEAAKQGQTGALITILQTLTQAAIKAGADVDTAQIQDAYNTLVSGLVTSINNGLSGTLSNVDFDNLIEQIGGAPEAYRQYVTETYEGLELSAEGVLAITTKLISQFGNSSTIINSLVENFGGDGLLGSYEAIDDLIQQIESNTSNWGSETQATLDILYKIRGVYSQMAEDRQFNILDRDPFEGKADNYYAFTQSVSDTVDLLKTAFTEGQKITEQPFTSLMDWFNEWAPEGLQTKIGETNVTLKRFQEAVMATKDATGQLDVALAASNLGISLEDMSGALDGGIQEIAESQKAYWTSYLNFLKGIKQLQESSKDIAIEPPKMEFDDQGNLTAEAQEAYKLYLEQIYNAFESSEVEQFSGDNNPLNQLWKHLGWGNTFSVDTVPPNEKAQAVQYVANLVKWFTGEFTTDDIYDIIGENNKVDIPFESIINMDPSAAFDEVAQTDSKTPIQEAVLKTIESWGFKSDGSGSYVYTLAGLTLKVALGADGTPVTLDLTNATGNPPTAEEMREVFAGKPGFSPGTNGDWTFTDAVTGIVYKCTNGKVYIDSTNFTPPSTTPASEVEEIIRKAGWNSSTEDGITKYSTTIDGWKFEYTAGAEDIEVTKPGALVPETFTISDLLNGNLWQAVTGETSYTQDTGWQFEYNTTTKSITVKSPDGVFEEIDINSPDFKNGWVGDGTTYTKELNGYTFTYNKSTSTLTVSPPSAPEDPDLTKIFTEANGWKSTTAGIYSKTLDETTLNYNAITGQFSTITPEGGPTTDENISKIVKDFFGSTATYKNGVITFSDGTKINMNASKGSLLDTLQTGTAQGYSLSEIATAFFGPGVTCKGNVITLPSGTTIDLDATIGEILATSEEEGATTGLSTEELVKQIFGEDAVYDSTTGTITMPDGVTIDLNASLKDFDLSNPNTEDGSYSIVLTPDTNLIDTALAAYNNQPIKISLELTNSKNSLLNSPAYNDLVAKTRAYLDGNLSMGDMQTAYYQAYQAFIPYISSMSREDLLALQQLQESINFGLYTNEKIEEGTWWTALGEEVSVALAALPEEEEIAGITSLFNSLSNEGLTANLLGLTSLFSALVSPELATLDLTNFIAQIESMGELELDDEEIENLTVIALALTEALTPLANATVNPVITIDNTQAISAIDEIKKALDDLPETKTITIDQRLGLLPLKTQLYTGNVNGIAYAEGNINKLISGAHLANKTLVGELGPELAVYNNQYHLLGRDGAEFVNLPSDAIVFNHRQTEGIIKGQTGYRGKALANGNVSGPAAASGIDAAIAAVENIIALWSNLGEQSVSDLLANSGGGGGGGGNELKAVTAELQEWYNLTRRIAYEEQEINNLIAERNNILDGGDYLKNLRETEKHLKSQRVLQSQLLDYQTQQLQRQADFINDHDIWSKYLYIDENGLLQYINGNETNGGKGALEILESFNKMSGEEQQKYLKSVNYSFTDQDGKELEGSELAEKFLEQLQAQIDQYDELYDTVHSTEETIEGINSNIKEINEEIKQNQMDLEQAIYEIIESAWEKEIEQLEKQVELIEEANNAYVEGLQDALNAEKEAYSDNQSIEEREALQRQLSLLRRSGGSASEIADLEKQLDDTLKDEYFRNQEKMIENIEEANENQIKLLEKQITLQEEALAFEKENGVLWTKVYEVMSRSETEILEFMQGNHTDFFSQSLLQQEEMLTDWAKKIGIYSEDRQYQNHIDAATSIWNSQGFWNSNTLKGLQNTYNQLSSEGQSDLRDIFSTTYAQEIMAGSDADDARLKAEEEVKTYLDKYQKENSSQNTESSGNNGSSNQGGNGGLNHSKLYYGGYTKNHTFIGGENCYADGLAKAKELARGKGIEVDKGNDWFRTGSSPVKAWRKWYVAKGDKKLTQDYSTKSQAENARISGISGNYNNYVNAQRSGADAATVAKLKQIYEDFNSSDIKFFSTGGLVDYTGLAMVHGSKSKPEGFLNAEQTAQIKEALSVTSGKENLLSNLRTTIDKLRSLIHNISTIDNSNNYEINIAPGAVAIQVAQIADSYDIEELSNDVMNRMVAIASKATNRGVNRR